MKQFADLIANAEKRDGAAVLPVSLVPHVAKAYEALCPVVFGNVHRERVLRENGLDYYGQRVVFE